MRLGQYYRSAAARAADLQRRQPVEARLGLLVGGRIFEVTELAVKHYDLRTPQYLGVLAACVAAGDEWSAFRAELSRRNAAGPAADSIDPAEAFFAPCIPRPSQFLDFYAFEQHVRTGRRLRGKDFIVPEWYEIPAYYNANPMSLIGHGMTAFFPPDEQQMDYECELACVVGREVRNATPETAAAAIAGYTILNDFSSRQRQMQAMKINMGPAPGKDFASALGPWLVTPDEIADLGALGMRAYVNGEQWTDGRYGAVQHSFESMIVYASRSRTLYPGDVLGSGTVGGGCGLELGQYLRPGDVVRIEIDELGTLENTVQHEPE